jgi:hypothetical protein
MADDPTYLAPTQCTISSFVLEGVDPSTRSSPWSFATQP